MQSPQIENFESFLISNLGNDLKIISFTSKYLTKPGDNYGSCMLDMKVLIKKNNTEKIDQLNLVVKMPPTNELFWKLFEPERTCLTENSIYNELIPALEKLLKDDNISIKNELLDIFPKCYGIRTSLSSNSNNYVDKNAILMLENLIPMGYKVADRLESYDYQHTIIALKSLAKYHALPIALRILKPKIFKENIMPNIRRYDISKNFDKQMFDEMVMNSKTDIKSLPEFGSEEFLKRVDHFIDLSVKYMANPNECNDTLFTTIAHYDFWVNNMMFLYDENKNPLKIKILDFQIAQYESLAHDIVFFIFSSVKNEIINEKYDELLQYYYDEFIKLLKLVGCDISEYSFKKFIKEIECAAPIQFFHILTMLKVVLIEKQSLPDDFSEMNADTMKNENAYSGKYFNKLNTFLKFFMKKGYLNY